VKDVRPVRRLVQSSSAGDENDVCNDVVLSQFVERLQTGPNYVAKLKKKYVPRLKPTRVTSCLKSLREANMQPSSSPSCSAALCLSRKTFPPKEGVFGATGSSTAEAVYKICLRKLPATVPAP
jgi:hypothetical protein